MKTRRFAGHKISLNSLIIIGKRLFCHLYSPVLFPLCFSIVLLLLTIYPQLPLVANLKALEKQLHKELTTLNVPEKNWTRRPPCVCEPNLLDVAIIGGGMAGNTVAFALIKEGITHIKIFDTHQEGNEGSWNQYARMKQLRSSKHLPGPALGIPSLTFRAWYEAIRGHNAWEALGFIPTKTWIEYLQWYRKILNLPIHNGMTLKDISLKEQWLELTFKKEDTAETYLARKVVLATGMEGFGGTVIPSFMTTVPKSHYATAYEPIDPMTLKDKRVAVIGAGASAFDSAAFALENGATRVDMLVRRGKIPTGKVFTPFSDHGVNHGFYWLPDDLHCHFFAAAFASGISPPKAALNRVAEYTNFHVHLNSEIQKVTICPDGVLLHTAHEYHEVDLIILATGFAIDGLKRSELQELMPMILLWKDKIPKEILKREPKLGKFPYLGPSFQFLESVPGIAPSLQNIYCFNYGSFLSHGPITCDINGIGVGAERLARGIASDFLLRDPSLYFPSTLLYNSPPPSQ